MGFTETLGCPVCGDANYDVKYRLTEFAIHRCRDCALVYLWPRRSPEQIRELFEQLYTVGEGSVPELKTYYSFCYEDVPDNPLVQSYEAWLDKIEAVHAPGRILDIGCGTGLFLAVARRRGWETFGVDESEEATTHAKEHFALDVRIGEFSQFASEGIRFDAITGWDIIEHAREPVTLLEAARSSLAPGGIVALSTPNQRSILDLIARGIYGATGGRVKDPLEKFYIEQHFVYFTEESLSDTCRRAGLEVVTMERELTDLRRLTLSPVMRFVLKGLFAASRLAGLENRLFTLARASD